MNHSKHRILSLLLSAALLLAPCALPAAAAEEDGGRFSDVAGSAWYAGYVETLAGRGVVSGYEDGTFRPDNAVTWGEGLKLILRAAGFPAQTAAEGEHWAEGYRAFAAARGYLPADAAAELDAPMTREAAAALCAAALELDTRAAAQSDTPFADTDAPAALAVYGAGVMQGSFDEAGRRVFLGGDAFRRCEICVVLTNMLDYTAENFLFAGDLRAAVDHSLPRNPYDAAAFRAADGRVYYDDPAFDVRYGVDVSYFQGEIDWEAVAADGIDFAMIRCGFRGWGSAGSLNEDEYFRENVEGALAAGLDVGVYFFSQALSVEEAREEAAYTLALIEGYALTWPVVFDWEQVANPAARSADPDWDAVTDCAAAFCAAVAAAGYTPAVYYDMTTAYFRLDLSRLRDWDCWLASWRAVPNYVYDYRMWQYSDAGHVDGIEGNVDMDICFVPYE